MTNTTTTRPAIDLREIINAAAATCVVADYMIDFFDATTDLGDTIDVGAEDATSIYRSDILAFISAHPDTLADVVAEGLYIVNDSMPYDLCRHGQAAEYWTHSREAYDHLDDIHHGIAAHYILHTHGLTEIPADTWDEIKSAIDIVQPDTYGDIYETVDSVISTDDNGDYMQPLTVTAFDRGAM